MLKLGAWAVWQVRKRLPDSLLTPIELFLRSGGDGLLFPADVSARARAQGSFKVLDFGAYIGDYAQRALAGGASRVYAFEPVPAFADVLRRRFTADERVVICEFALGQESGAIEFFEQQDATGTNAAGESVIVRVESIQVLSEMAGTDFDVAKINIEGGEYDLIPLLDDFGFLTEIETLFVQFHLADERSQSGIENCRSILSKSHRQTWNFQGVWERWDRNY